MSAWPEMGVGVVLVVVGVGVGVVVVAGAMTFLIHGDPGVDA